MALYAISDLHLSLSGDKPMDVFSEEWKNHDMRIRENWLKKVKEEDTVLLAGDLSWSMKLQGGKEELDFVAGLPGRKIIIKGNHDYWWGSITKLNSMYDNMDFIQNNFFAYEDYAICGTRGWVLPGSSLFKEEDEKIFRREVLRLKMSLDAAKKRGFQKFIVMIHYPPVNETFKDSEFTDIFEEYGVEKVIYGHLHGKSLQRVMTGERKGVEYILTSCDYIGFDPVLIKT
ncbi:metallophosphoesterase [Proteiniclasticum ruminis]|uniref:metallophosphoesterase n=1 Tax=Proteiniclasticum ruminis TaxID=398199 RepID=UPI00289E88B0|nr:metallophosphoesterase [Proteiniclasticum ruminis]